MTTEKSAPHPGEVVYIDGNSGQVIERVPAAQVPEKHRFAPTADGLVPIVRVVATEIGNERRIEEFGPEGQLLRSTRQRRS